MSSSRGGTLPAHRIVSLWREALKSAVPSHDEIAKRAYYKHLAHRGESDAVANWLDAERELLVEHFGDATNRR
jgi:hypothetical protein